MFEKFYYSQYKFLMLFHKTDVSKFNSYVGLSFFQVWNLTCIIMFINKYLKLEYTKNEGFWIALTIVAIIFITNFFVLYRNFYKIELKFSKMSNKFKFFWYILCAFYSIGSIQLAFWCIDNLAIHKN
jgi:hypothetical protein